MKIFFHQQNICHQPPDIVAKYFFKYNLQAHSCKMGFYYHLSSSLFNSINAEFTHQKLIWNNNLLFDINVIDDLNFAKNLRLVAFDMDSTVTSVETLDALAKYYSGDLINFPKIEELTNSAMSGKMSFRESLNLRLALFQNFPEANITKFLEKPLPLENGVADFINELHQNKIKTILISGGFSQFALKLKSQLSFAEVFSNSFEIVEGKLNGKYLEPLIDGEGKKRVLINYCQKNLINPAQVMAIGDGANDFQMLASCGYPIAFRGKEFLREKITTQINYAPMSAIIDFWQE